MTRLLLSPDTTLSPPVSVTATPVNRKLPGIRARRLRLSHVDSEHFPDFRREGWAPGTLTAAAETSQISAFYFQSAKSLAFGDGISILLQYSVT